MLIYRWKRTIRLAMWRRGRTARAAAAIFLALLAAFITAARLSVDLPDPDRLIQRASPETTKLYDRRGRLFHEVLDPRTGSRTRASLSDLSSSLIHAVVSIEDAGFFEHPGVDARAIARALAQAARHRRIVSGASTITQQLARLQLLEPEERSQRTLRRKLREAILALRIERTFDKATILELYLNEIYFGQLSYGIEAAAQTFFDKPAHALDLAESALLAGMIQAPAAYNPLIDLDAAVGRQRIVLRRMEALGHINSAEREAAEAERLRLVSSASERAAPHFTTWVLGRLEESLGSEAVAAGGLHVITSLSLDSQRLAESAIQSHLASLAARGPDAFDHNARNASLVALDPETGDVLALVGSADAGDETIDGAVNMALSPRQPGSAFKPIVYATAMDPKRWGLGASSQRGLSTPRLPFAAGSVLSDVPTAFETREGEPYRPQNYDRTWHGPIDLRTALATSSNLVAVKVLEEAGLDATIEQARSMGINTLVQPKRYGLALALGGAEMRLLELTTAYGAFATGGYRVTPRPVLAVLDGPAFREWSDAMVKAVDSDGRKKLETVDTIDGAIRGAARPRVLDERVAYLITDILSDDSARLPAFGEGSPLRLSRPAAAKTGTTTGFRDNWTVGYTPDLVAGVWVGNADNSPMKRISGISGAGPIWNDFMESAHAGLPSRQFARPAGLVERDICAPSGLLATELCSRRVREIFIAGTEPIEKDDSYVSLTVDAASGNVWAAGCRGPRVERTFLQVPGEAQSWAMQRGVQSLPVIDCHGNASENSVLVGSARNASSDASSLRMTRPAAGTMFELSDRIPIDSQRIELEAAKAGKPVRRVVFFVDDEAVAERTAPPWRASWRPSSGHHTVRAEAELLDGRTLIAENVTFGVVDSAAVSAPANVAVAESGR